MKEIWKDIKGFEGLYQISNLGRVRSLDRWVERINGGYFQSGRIRKLGTTRGGYLFVPLMKNGEAKNYRINRLVAEAFLEGYSKSAEVHHKDGNVTNNRADNLECLNSKEHHSKHLGKAVEGTNGIINLTFKQISETEKLGFNPANIARCCKAALLEDGNPRKKKYATHKGFTWRYI